MLRSPSDTARSGFVERSVVSESVEELLRDLGPHLRRGGGSSLDESLDRLPTGLPDIDRLLGNGFPRGRLSEIAGAASSGRTSLALALLARTTEAGEVTAVVDAPDAFDPASAEAAGVRLERVLWVRPSRRPPSPSQASRSAHARGSSRDTAGTEALRATERILEAHGFALVVLDLAVDALRLAPAAGPRLARAAASTGTALLVLTRERALGSAAEIALELTSARSHFTGMPTLLESLEIEADLVRHRTVPHARCARVRLRTQAA